MTTLERIAEGAILGVVTLWLIYRNLPSVAKKRAQWRRGWNNPYTYTNWITFVLHDGRRIASLEQGEKLEEILEDMTVVIEHRSYYKITYPNSPPRFVESSGGYEPHNFEQTPYLQAMLPHNEVMSVWMQREYKRRRTIPVAG